jgi:hypothetical protein
MFLRIAPLTGESLQEIKYDLKLVGCDAYLEPDRGVVSAITRTGQTLFHGGPRFQR